MTERSERFRARRARLESGDGKTVPPLADAELVGNMLSQAIDWAQIDSVAVKPPVFDCEVTDEEVAQCLSELDQALTRQKYDVLFDGVKDTLIDQLLRPLHLSRSQLAEDGDRKFEYKDVEAEYRKGSARYSQEKEKMMADGKLKDEYTGKMIPPGQAELDHIIPLKKLHERGGFMLTDEEKKNLGNDPDNLAFTDWSINRSKGATPLKDQKNLDRRRTRHLDERAERSVSRQIPKGMEFAKRAAGDGVKMGTLQALQQSLSFLISELISAVFSEVKDALLTLDRGRKSGSKDLTWPENLNAWLMSLTKRLDRIKSRLLSRWQDLVAALGTGWLSGFLSATITAVLNMFVQTGRNMVRIIREGFLSIMRAVAVLINPPEGMGPREAAHEASKVLTTGLVVTGGILAGEAIANVWSSFPFGNIFASVLGGLISGLGSLFVVFMLDKLDIFGVMFEERHAFIMGSLEGRISEATRGIDDILNKSRLK